MADHERAAPDDGRATIARLADEVLPALIERLSKSDLGELEVRESGWRIRLRRPVESAGPGPLQAVGPGAATHAPPVASAHGSNREPARGVVGSPAVGYFTPRQGLEVGAALRGGDVIGHVDVLGVRHEVALDGGGVLKSFDVEPGQAVEYGQAVARVESEG